MATLSGSAVFTTPASWLRSNAPAMAGAMAIQRQTKRKIGRMRVERTLQAKKNPAERGLVKQTFSSRGSQITLTTARHEAHQPQAGEQHRIRLRLGNDIDVEAAPGWMQRVR